MQGRFLHPVRNGSALFFQTHLQGGGYVGRANARIAYFNIWFQDFNIAFTAHVDLCFSSLITLVAE